jgi:hypothetical protein
MKVGLDGGMPTMLASGQSGPGGIAVDATTVYWVNSGTKGKNDGAVMKVGLDGDTLTTLASGQNYPSSIAVDATTVYWMNPQGGTVMKVAK